VLICNDIVGDNLDPKAGGVKAAADDSSDRKRRHVNIIVLDLFYEISLRIFSCLLTEDIRTEAKRMSGALLLL